MADLDLFITAIEKAELITEPVIKIPYEYILPSPRLTDTST